MTSKFIPNFVWKNKRIQIIAPQTSSANMSNYCWNHDLFFNNHEAYKYHMDNDCAQMLSKKNVCIFLKEGEKCCKESFKTTTALLAHYKEEHNLYACALCYATSDTIEQLEEHSHNESVNLRLSMKDNTLFQQLLRKPILQSHIYANIVYSPGQPKKHEVCIWQMVIVSKPTIRVSLPESTAVYAADHTNI